MKRLFGGSGGLWKPKNPHSLEHLKQLYAWLTKNATVTEQNRNLIVEALRSISEILIWGDQNDSTVFDFFLEKQMLSFFLKIMKQKCGRYVCVQLLQTLNILFENIRHETSLYFLLSNNHVNSIITHRFDFSDEEVMAYYISFLKTLSFKLNNYTIHFFFNEQTNDFPLYTEAIKFFNHSEGMVRIAVRTLTLNVYKVNDEAMLKFIRDKTAAPYFSNLVWFIRNHIIDIDTFIQSQDDTENSTRDRLSDLLAEHLDHLHYVNDILCLHIEPLNQVLSDQLLHRLFLPLYLGSLLPQSQPATLHVTRVMSLFLLSQVFLIITHSPLVEHLLSLLLFGDQSDLNVYDVVSSETIQNLSSPDCFESQSNGAVVEIPEDQKRAQKELSALAVSKESGSKSPTGSQDARPVFSNLLCALDCSKSDHDAFFSLVLLYAIGHNSGVPASLLEAAQLQCNHSSSMPCDKDVLRRLVQILQFSGQKGSQVRLVTVELCCLVLRQFILASESEASFMQDQFLAQLVAAKEAVVEQLCFYYKTEDMFLDLFEDEYQRFDRTDIKVHFVSADSVMLLEPVSTPFGGIEFSRRLPCGPQEHARRALRVFFLLRQFLLDLDGTSDTRLPLSDPKDFVIVNDCLNLSNSDLLSCTVALQNGQKAQRFLVTDGLQLILVEPDTKRLGWGIVRFVGFLQDMELSGDKDDSRSLQVTIHQASSKLLSSSAPALSARFIFDDHIRCMAAKQRLTKGRQKARAYKMELIADLLELPPTNSLQPSGSNSPAAFRFVKQQFKGKVPGYVSLDTPQVLNPAEELDQTMSVASSSVSAASGSMLDIDGKIATPQHGGGSRPEAIPLTDMSPTTEEPSEISVVESASPVNEPALQCFMANNAAKARLKQPVVKNI